MPETPSVSAAAVAAHDGPVLFIADAPNGLERKLLETWMAPGGAVVNVSSISALAALNVCPVGPSTTR